MRERHARKRLLTMAALAAVLIAAGATAVAYGLTGHDGSYSRPSGIPASIPDSQVNLMELSPVPVRPAPGFTLTDQDGRVLPLSAFRGKVVVLEFMDPHCTDICPIVSAEFTDAYRDLGQAGRPGRLRRRQRQPVPPRCRRRSGVLSRPPARPPSPAGISSPGRCRGCGPSGMATTSRCRHQAQMRTSCHPRPSYFIDPGGRERYIAVPRPTTPRRGPRTCRQDRSRRGAGASPRSRRSSPATSRAARQCSDMHRREPPLVTVRRYTGPVTATSHAIDILL